MSSGTSTQRSGTSVELAAHFRPQPLLPPRLDLSPDAYLRYVETYHLYVHSLEALKNEFWSSAEAARSHHPRRTYVLEKRPQTVAADAPAVQVAAAELFQMSEKADRRFERPIPLANRGGETRHPMSVWRAEFDPTGSLDLSRTYHFRSAGRAPPSQPVAPATTTRLVFGCFPIDRPASPVAPSVSAGSPPGPPSEQVVARRRAARRRYRHRRAQRRLDERIEDWGRSTSAARAQASVVVAENRLASLRGKRPAVPQQRPVAGTPRPGPSSTGAGSSPENLGGIKLPHQSYSRGAAPATGTSRSRRRARREAQRASDRATTPPGSSQASCG
jgi:hypothetical protein